MDSLQARGIDMLFVIGGDGSMRGAWALWKKSGGADWRLRWVGIP
ncbi:MAG: hypothetical protein R3E89_14405 [Thiolinea sp.]